MELLFHVGGGADSNGWFSMIEAAAIGRAMSGNRGRTSSCKPRVRRIGS
jgi:hypothetical protein